MKIITEEIKIFNIDPYMIDHVSLYYRLNPKTNQFEACLKIKENIDTTRAKKLWYDYGSQQNDISKKDYLEFTNH